MDLDYSRMSPDPDAYLADMEADAWCEELIGEACRLIETARLSLDSDEDAIRRVLTIGKWTLDEVDWLTEEVIARNRSMKRKADAEVAYLSFNRFYTET